jgi:uncharacterized membrane protein
VFSGIYGWPSSCAGKDNDRERASQSGDEDSRSNLLTTLKRRNIVAKLIVVGFKKDMYRASEVLNQLQSMNDDWVVDLHDAVAVYRDYNGKLRVDQSYQMTTREGAAWGGLMGSLIGLTLAAIPFTGGASAVAAGTLAAGAAAGGALGAGAASLTISSSRSGP